MIVSVSKRRPRTSKKTETEKRDKSLKDHRICCNSICSVFSTSVLYIVPLTIFFLFVIYLWSTSTNVISGNIVRICISARKLNDHYCLTAGSRQPGLNVPVSNFTKLVSENEIRSEEEKSVVVLGDGGEKSFEKNQSFSTRERVSELDQELKPINGKNLNSFLEQDFCQPENEINPSLLVDWDSEIGEEPYRYIIPKDEVEERGLKAVHKHLKMQRSWLFIGNNQGTCQGQGIYVYDLPSKFNKDLLGECSDMVPWVNFCSYFKNDGLGPSIENLGKGWFNTHQYSLEPIFHSRFLKHPCRVYDENQAKLFYVPFYGGMDVLRWHFKNVSNDVKDVLAIEVVKWLGSKISWRNMI